MLLSTDGNDYKNSPKNNACTTHCVVHAAGGEGGIRPAALGQCRRQPGELKNHSLDGFFPATGGPFPSHPSFFYAARKRDRKCDLFFVAVNKKERDSKSVIGIGLLALRAAQSGLTRFPGR